MSSDRIWDLSHRREFIPDFLYSGQNPKVEIIASLPWGETITIVLLNEYIAKLSWKYLDLHPQISAALGLGWQSSCLHWTVVNAETHN